MRLASHARKPGLAPKVSGYVVNASFTDNRHVKAGEVLAHIDERDYKIALAAGLVRLVRAHRR